jgi:hypothetical protein
MPERTPEDRLREEYFDLLPEIRKVTENPEAEVRYRTLKSRIKECERGRFPSAEAARGDFRPRPIWCTPGLLPGHREMDHGATWEKRHVAPR